MTHPTTIALPRVAWRARAAVTGAALAILAFSAPPAAAEIDAEAVVAETQKIFDKIVGASDAPVETSGRVTYEREGELVTITIPGITVREPYSVVTVPDASFSLMEMDDNRLAFSINLPSGITGERTQPRPQEFRLTIGDQDIVGVYRRDIAFYEELKGTLGAVKLDSNVGALGIKTMSYVSDNTEQGPGDWTSNGFFDLAGLSFSDPNGAPTVVIRNLAIGSEIQNADFARYLEINRRMTDATLPAELGGEPDEAAMNAAMAEMVAAMPEMLAGSSGSMAIRLSGLEVAIPGEPSFDLNTAVIATDIAPAGDNYDLAIELGFTDPQVDPAAVPLPSELVPQKLQADVALRQLPIFAIWQSLSDPLQRQFTGDPTGEAANQLEMAPMIAMGAAAEAGTFAEIEGLEFVVGPATLNAKGVGPILPSLPQPPLKIEASIDGLDALVEIVQGLPQGISQQATPVALVLRGLGTPKADDGKIVYEYLIEQGPKGPSDIIVNGVSLSDMKPPK